MASVAHVLRNDWFGGNWRHDKKVGWISEYQGKIQWVNRYPSQKGEMCARKYRYTGCRHLTPDNTLFFYTVARDDGMGIGNAVIRWYLLHLLE